MAHCLQKRFSCAHADGARWTQSLPEIVSAIFYPINGRVDAREGDATRARFARDAFMQRFGLTSTSFPPLLTYDVGAARNGGAPWGLAP